MSGGHWNYANFRIQDGLETIAEDEDVEKRWPIISKVFGNLAAILYNTAHDMDWDLSGDTLIVDDKKFELEAMDLLRRVTNDGSNSINKLLEAVDNILELFEHFERDPFQNGVIASGVDEGSLKGWRLFRKFKAEYEKAKKDL